jgi:uncharacterized protein
VTSIPILCFSKFSTHDQLLRFARAEGKKWRAKFLRQIKEKQYRLTEQRELFKIDGICALFNAANLRVAWFSDRLSEVLSLLKGYCDITAFQRIHDQVSARFLPKADQEHGVQLPHFWMLLLELLENDFMGEEQAGQTASAQCQARFNRLTSLIVPPSLSCNFRCDYCYHRGIARSRKAQVVLTSDKVRRGIDYFLANTSVPISFSRSIRFTGGEPTLHYELIRDALEYATEIRLRDPRLAPFKFSMVTNAALINDRWTELIKKHGLLVAVSLDGRQPRNDLRRKSVKGSAYLGSTAGIKRLNEAGIQPALFITVSSHNIDTLAEDVTWLFERFQFAAFSFNLDTSFTRKYRVAPADYTLGIIKAYTELSYRGLFDLKVTRVSRRFQSKKSSVSGCGGIFSHMVLFPDGSVGPCPRLAGDATQRMDIVEDQELCSSRLFRRWSKFDYFQNPRCQRCNYRNMCEGWCPYASMQLTGRISEPNEYNCLYTKTILEWLIWLDYARALKGEE